ncbi:MAG: Teichoic acid translocation permease protein TagG [Anaerolineales bacterium]|nr:Teichoic acid translocation permease protein TagG [Anaerolineales bacterium]
MELVESINPSEESWDMVIRPQRSLFDLRLGELWRYRDLVALFVRRDFVAVYKQTVLGPLWYLIQPLLTTITFTVIFGNIASLPTDGLPQFLFYMSGTVVWSYFSECLNKTSNTFVQNANLFGKVYFPRMAVPVSVLISNLITFAIQFVLFLLFVLYFALSGSDIQVHWTWVVLSPLLIAMMAGLGLGFGIIISSLTTKYRDLRFLVTFGVQLLMYATPVIYPVSSIPEKYQWIILANPMTPIVEAFRYAFLGAGAVESGYLLYSFGFMLVVALIGAVIFNRVEQTFMDTV